MSIEIIERTFFIDPNSEDHISNIKYCMILLVSYLEPLWSINLVITPLHLRRALVQNIVTIIREREGEKEWGQPVILAFIQWRWV